MSGFIGDTTRYIKEGLQGASYDCKMALKWEFVACKREKLYATYLILGIVQCSIWMVIETVEGKRDGSGKEPDLQMKAQKML